MGFDISKRNFKDLGLDLKGLVSSSVCTVIDTLKIPVSFCKDIRNNYLERKNNVNVCKAIVKCTNEIKQTEEKLKPKPIKKVVKECPATT